MWRWATALCVSVLSLGASVARAQDVATTELGAWPDTVSALQSDVGAQGRSVSVCVREARACLPCARYTLALDEAGAQAFAVGACDRRAGTTELTLVDRSALFDHGHAVPRPRAIALRAAVVHEVTSVGGAPTSGGSAVGCTAQVRPFLRDLEHGGVVYLGPASYELRPHSASVSVTAHDTRWLLTSDARLSAAVDYDVVERSTGETVLSGHATLECSEDTRMPGAPSSWAGLDVGGPTGELWVRSDVGASVFVDGLDTGRTPLLLRLSEGSHEVRVVGPHGLAQSHVVSIVPGRRVSARCTFERHLDGPPSIPSAPAPTSGSLPFDPWTSPLAIFAGEPIEASPRCVDDAKIAMGRDGHGAGSCIGTAPSPEPFVFTVRIRTTFHARLVNEFGGSMRLERVGPDDGALELAETDDLHGTASIDRVLEPGRYALTIETPQDEAGHYRLAWAFEHVGRHVR